MVVVGTAVGTVLLAALGVLVAGLTGTSPVRVPGFPDGGQPAPAGQLDPAGDGAAGLTEPGAETAGQPVVQPTPGATTEAPNRRVPTQTPAHRPKPTKT
jgi:hypothetical protein